MPGAIINLMANDDEHKPLSKADAALWEKVKQSIATPNAEAKRAEKAPKSSDKAAPSRPEKPAHKAPTTEDFAALLEASSPALNIVPNARKTTELKPEQDAADDQKAAKPIRARAKPLPYRPKSPAPSSKKQVAPLQKREARNISSGKDVIEAAIDLHGLTAREAETALKTFLSRAYADNKRLALVITGKGQRRPSEQRAFELGAPEPGILRREVPGWLNALPDIVQSHGPANKKHGGDGALYVRLRRKKK